MSITIVEEKQPSNGLFLPPAISNILDICRIKLNFVPSAILLLSAVALFLLDCLSGLVLFGVAVLFLCADCVLSCSTKRQNPSFCSARLLLLISAVLSLIYSLALTFKTELYEAFNFELPVLFSRLNASMPNFLNDIVGTGFQSTALLFLCIFAVALIKFFSVNSLKRSYINNMPYCGISLFGFILNLTIAIVLIAESLSYLGIVLPLISSKFSLGAADYANLGALCGTALFVLFEAVISLITFIKIRKVKNAVFKA